MIVILANQTIQIKTTVAVTNVATIVAMMTAVMMTAAMIATVDLILILQDATDVIEDKEYPLFLILKGVEGTLL